jgi:hypothetical protein
VVEGDVVPDNKSHGLGFAEEHLYVLQ